MEETPMTMVGIVIAAIIMLVVPLIIIADRSDDISQLLVQTATSEFVDEVIKTGKITSDKYEKFRQRLSGSGNIYEVEIELKILDENTAKFYINNNDPRVGNNTYYSIYTSQIEEMLQKSAESGAISNSEAKIVLKQGDAIFITVSNESQTLSQSLKNFYSGVGKNNIKIITATASGTIAISGTR